MMKKSLLALSVAAAAMGAQAADVQVYGLISSPTTAVSTRAASSSVAKPTSTSSVRSASSPPA